MYSPKTSATNFVHELCSCRAKENLAPLLQLVTATFDVFKVSMGPFPLLLSVVVLLDSGQPPADCSRPPTVAYYAVMGYGCYGIEPHCEVQT